MFVDMNRERNTMLDNRNVYDENQPMPKIPIKYPDIKP